MLRGLVLKMNGRFLSSYVSLSSFWRTSALPRTWYGGKVAFTSLIRLDLRVTCVLVSLGTRSTAVSDWGGSKVWCVVSCYKLCSLTLFPHSHVGFTRQLNYFNFRKIAGRTKMAPCKFVNESTTEDVMSLLSIKRRKPSSKKTKSDLQREQAKLHQLRHASTMGVGYFSMPFHQLGRGAESAAAMNLLYQQQQHIMLQSMMRESGLFQGMEIFDSMVPSNFKFNEHAATLRHMNINAKQQFGMRPSSSTAGMNGGSICPSSAEDNAQGSSFSSKILFPSSHNGSSSSTFNEESIEQDLNSAFPDVVTTDSSYQAFCRQLSTSESTGNQAQFTTGDSSSGSRNGQHMMHFGNHSATMFTDENAIPFYNSSPDYLHASSLNGRT